MRYPIVPLRSDQLRGLASPQAAGIPESIPFMLYDTQLYVTTATTELTFFTATQNDRSLSNLGSGGSLPSDQWFRIYGICLDVFREDATFATTAAGGAVGAIDDLGRLVMSGRGRWNLTISDKSFGPMPLSTLHATGGPVGFGWGTFTAEESIQYANNGHPDGGWWVDGSIFIPPRIAFNLVAQWPAAVTLTDDYYLRVGLLGTLYRRVL